MSGPRKAGNDPSSEVSPWILAEAVGQSERGADHARSGIANQAFEIVLHGDDELIVISDLHQREIPYCPRPVSLEGAL